MRMRVWCDLFVNLSPMGKGIASSSWRNFFALLSFTFLLLMNAACCVSFEQRQPLCQEEERSALLQFRASFTIDKSASQNPLAYPKVATWATLGGDPQRSDCCSWDGVECNEDSGHVIGLDLASGYLHGSINSSSSLFQLVHLQRLDLSDNNFSYSEIPSRLGLDLTSLTYLNLSKSWFNGHIPSELSYLSKLSILDLFSDEFWSRLRMPNFGSIVQNLTNIKQLHLSAVEIGSALPNTLLNLSSLTVLQLDACALKGEFPVDIFNLPNLQVLDLNQNDELNGYLPEDLNRSSPLKILNLRRTNFSGHLPASIGNLRALNLLNIASCNFYSPLPSSLANLTQLNFLDLSSFHAQVSDSWTWVGKLTNLYHLCLGDTNFKGDLPSLANLTQLSKLDLSHNQISGQIPSWLVQLTQLTWLDLRFNNLQGVIPWSLFELRNLEFLCLNSNNLSGSVEFDEFSKLEKLKQLYLSSNKLSVQIKTGFVDIPTNLQHLGLGSCNLTEFPDFLKYTDQLADLDLSDNNLHGQIPKWLWNATGETLLFLKLSHNHLTGFEENPVIIPWPHLINFELDSNMLRGSLPIPGSPVQNLQIYSVSNNKYGGEIPATLCNMETLRILDLSNNSLNGMIQHCFENLTALQILKLQHNSFQGDIPQICSNGCKDLTAIDLSYNQLQGKPPGSVVNCPQLLFLNLGNNQLSDIFPYWLGGLQHLRVLILRSNAFHGMIGKPASSNEFPQLCIVDLSSNEFSGILPSDYLKNWNAMISVDAKEQVYVQSIAFLGFFAALAYDSYSMTVFSKGVQLNYTKTPYLLRLIDFSSNRFEGDIPSIIGNLRGLKLLNLSHNSLSGLIPSSLGNLTALEALDLTQNQLSGKIPADLAQLTFLAYLNVSHNRLHGPIPQGRQFDTFPEETYQGNSGLCGKPLSKKCGDSESTTPQTSSYEEDEDSGFQIELDWFVVLPGVVAGVIVGVIGGNIWTDMKHEWFVETFSRRRRTRSTRQRRA